jgi:biotin transport system substrate-specific component
MEAVLKREIIVNKQLCRMFAIASFVILTSLGAFVRIPLPFTPVPLTLQTFFVLLAGALLGSRLGAITQLSYIFIGILGLPVFTAVGGGLGYLSGPTAGYLCGFVAASFFLGQFISSTRRNWRVVFLLFCAADLLLLVCGAVWLKIIFGLNAKTAFLIGILPFIWGDILKAAAASVVYTKLAPRAREIL